MDYPIQQYKIVCFGDCRVGKTCLIRRIVYNTFDANYMPVIRMDYFIKTI